MKVNQKTITIKLSKLIRTIREEGLQMEHHGSELPNMDACKTSEASAMSGDRKGCDGQFYVPAWSGYSPWLPRQMLICLLLWRYFRNKVHYHLFLHGTHFRHSAFWLSLIHSAKRPYGQAKTSLKKWLYLWAAASETDEGSGLPWQPSLQTLVFTIQTHKVYSVPYSNFLNINVLPNGSISLRNAACQGI